MADKMAERKKKALISEKEESVTETLKPQETGDMAVFLPKPPDGGWGWVIVGASLLANVIVDGITYTFGILLPSFQEAFQQPKSTVALAGSLQVGTYLCAGPVVSALTNRYGCKRVTIAGSVVAAAGFFLSCFAPNATVLILTFGVLAGFGFGMMYLPAVVIVGYWFEEKRSLATGIAVCGSGIGVFIMAPLSEFLLAEFGHRGTLMVMAGIVLHGAVCGMLMRPLPVPTKAESIEALSKPAPPPPAASQPEQRRGEEPTPVGQSGGETRRGEERKVSISRMPIITVLDSQDPSPSQRKETSPAHFAFSSVPSVMFAQTQAPPIARRQRSNTLDHIDTNLLSEVIKTVHLEEPKQKVLPVGMTYIGVSDATLQQARASTHMHVSRRDMLVSGSVLHVSDHAASLAHIKSGMSVRSGRSYHSVMSTEERVCACLPESPRDTLMQMLDLTILKDKAYVFILVGNVFAMLGFYVPFVFMPEVALDLGVEPSKAAFLLSIIGITNTVGRVLTGVLANLNKIDSLLINNMAMLVCGLVTLSVPLAPDYVTLCLLAALFGLCVAAYISLSSILICDMLGLEQLTNAFGFLTLARGISSCAGSPMAGAIIDATGSTSLAFYLGGALIVAGSLFHFLLYTPCIRHKPAPRVAEIDLS